MLALPLRYHQKNGVDLHERASFLNIPSSIIDSVFFTSDNHSDKLGNTKHENEDYHRPVSRSLMTFSSHSEVELKIQNNERQSKLEPNSSIRSSASRLCSKVPSLEDNYPPLSSSATELSKSSTAPVETSLKDNNSAVSLSTSDLMSSSSVSYLSCDKDNQTTELNEREKDSTMSYPKVNQHLLSYHETISIYEEEKDISASIPLASKLSLYEELDVTEEKPSLESTTMSTDVQESQADVVKIEVTNDTNICSESEDVTLVAHNVQISEDPSVGTSSIEAYTDAVKASVGGDNKEKKLDS